MDPAGPGFETGLSKLNVDAAEFVYVIHTDAGVYGTTLTNFTANFYPNLGARIQPGCVLSDFMSTGGKYHRFLISIQLILFFSTSYRY